MEQLEARYLHACQNLSISIEAVEKANRVIEQAIHTYRCGNLSFQQLQTRFTTLDKFYEAVVQCLETAWELDRECKRHEARMGGCPGCPGCKDGYFPDLFKAARALLAAPRPQPPEQYTFAVTPRLLFLKYLVNTGRLSEWDDQNHFSGMARYRPAEQPVAHGVGGTPFTGRFNPRCV
jgi:hypothetical protein